MTWSNASAFNDTDGSDDWPEASLALSSKAVTDVGSGVVVYDAADAIRTATGPRRLQLDRKPPGRSHE
ncbi:hypothetical protein OHA98_20740 [Streptomyces sp. NBC_00654]|uniref:hypothetical protein n=1 Tax=Streptomyces sp. NBC_00654 TaxID=2975799 RepID=UPI002250EC2C|nr:hypothetical protein [Streptomyces sp. NBC_00654]MCX4967167.1 hypothetical protein [Streptomyces sp. NBC_00654]